MYYLKPISLEGECLSSIGGYDVFILTTSLIFLLSGD